MYRKRGSGYDETRWDASLRMMMIRTQRVTLRRDQMMERDLYMGLVGEGIF